MTLEEHATALRELTGERLSCLEFNRMVIRVGTRLSELKKIVPRGNFTHIVVSQTRLSLRTAQQYMRVARIYTEDTVPNIPYGQILRMTAYR